MIARIVDETLRSSVEQVYVVTGPDSHSILEALLGRPVTFVVNSEVQSEMLDSVRCGIRALPETCTAALIVLGDQPGLTACLIDALIKEFTATLLGVALPSYLGKRGHPPLISMKYRDELLTRYDDTGLKGLIKAHKEDVCEVEVADPGRLEDMDFPEDYQRMKSLF